MKKTIEEILKHGEKPLDEVAELFETTPKDILESIIKKERATVEPVPAAAPGKVKKAPKDDRTDDQLVAYFLNRLEKESLSITALNNKYKINDEERVERILENMLREGKLTKRESRNKKGRFVYDAVKRKKEEKKKK
jgi:hypothetical protein